MMVEEVLAGLVAAGSNSGLFRIDEANVERASGNATRVTGERTTDGCAHG